MVPLRLEERERKKLKKDQNKQMKSVPKSFPDLVSHNVPMESRETSLIPEKLAKIRKKQEDLQFFSKVVVDLSFDSLMTLKEIRSLSNQIVYCYASNMKALYPVDLYLTSLGGNVEKHLLSQNGFKNWKQIHRDQRHFIDLFPKEDLVYLSSESEQLLESIDPTKVYIIGGIVDHNRLKGITHQRAEQFGIATIRLPIDKYIKMKTRKVLTVNQVFEIILQFLECKDWAVALEKVIPARKTPKVMISDGVPHLNGQNQKNNSTNDATANTKEHLLYMYGP